MGQSRWSKPGRKRRGRQRLLEGQEDAVTVEGGAEMGVKQALRRVKTLQEKTASKESYAKRQMMWEGMSGKS